MLADLTMMLQLILVWTPGKESPVHDHAGSHCVMVRTFRVLISSSDPTIESGDMSWESSLSRRFSSSLCLLRQAKLTPGS